MSVFNISIRISWKGIRFLVVYKILGRVEEQTCKSGFIYCRIEKNDKQTIAIEEQRNAFNYRNLCLATESSC
jgi:hypothetical protein